MMSADAPSERKRLEVLECYNLIGDLLSIMRELDLYGSMQEVRPGQSFPKHFSCQVLGVDSICSLRVGLGTTTNGEPKNTLELPRHLPGTATVPPYCCLYELKGLFPSLMTK